MSSPQDQTIDLASLTAPQLSSVQKQLTDEIQHLSDSFRQLRAAQEKFRECLRCMERGLRGDGGGGNDILVPLTSSLYVPGTLADKENVIVDVGTGFYVEKNTVDATTFYEKKVKELEANLLGLDKIVKGKSENLRVVENVLRQKVTSAATATPIEA